VSAAGAALEAALNCVQANRAQVVNIDVTGVTVLDSEVASTLMSTAATLRLLGSKTVISDIRVELTQTHIDLGAVDQGDTPERHRQPERNVARRRSADRRARGR
jgi:rsbT co-antagonist protein RsbR